VRNAVIVDIDRVCGEESIGPGVALGAICTTLVTDCDFNIFDQRLDGREVGVIL
jgi:hypothetical protein